MASGAAGGLALVRLLELGSSIDFLVPVFLVELERSIWVGGVDIKSGRRHAAIVQATEALADESPGDTLTSPRSGG